MNLKQFKAELVKLKKENSSQKNKEFLKRLHKDKMDKREKN